MLEYPAEDIDRIIEEEILHAEGTEKSYGPVARSRIEILLMSRLCAAWSQPAARTAIEAVAAAEKDLLYFCNTKQAVYIFIGDAYRGLIGCFLACEHAMDLTLAARPAWANPCAICAIDYLEEGIKAVGESWVEIRRNVQTLHRRGRRIMLHNGIFAKIHGALGLGFVAFLTLEEHTQFRIQLTRAMVRNREMSTLFPTSSDPTPRA